MDIRIIDVLSYENGIIVPLFFAISFVLMLYLFRRNKCLIAFEPYSYVSYSQVLFLTETKYI